MDLKVNNSLDEEYATIYDVLLQMRTPENFEKIFDFSKRILNEFGLCARTIELIYQLGYHDRK